MTALEAAIEHQRRVVLDCEIAVADARAHTLLGVERSQEGVRELRRATVHLRHLLDLAGEGTTGPEDQTAEGD